MCGFGGGPQGRALSRAKSRRNLDFQDVLDKLADKGIAIRVASPKLVMEEVGVEPGGGGGGGMLLLT